MRSHAQPAGAPPEAQLRAPRTPGASPSLARSPVARSQRSPASGVGPLSLDLARCLPRPTPRRPRLGDRAQGQNDKSQQKKGRRRPFGPPRRASRPLRYTVSRRRAPAASVRCRRASPSRRHLRGGSSVCLSSARAHPAVRPGRPSVRACTIYSDRPASGPNMGGVGDALRCVEGPGRGAVRAGRQGSRGGRDGLGR